MISLLSIENLDWLWRAGLIQATTFIFVFFSFINFSIIIDVKPIFLLIVIFYWSVYRPTILPPVLIFIIGLVQDLIYEYPLGLHSILYLCVYFLITRQRIYLMGQSYLNLWFFFSLTILSFVSIEWLFFSVRYFQIFGGTSLFFSALITIFLYPIVSLLLIFLNRLLNTVSSVDK